LKGNRTEKVFFEKVHSSPPLPSKKIWIIEHSSGIFIKWQRYFFVLRPKFSWAYRDEEGFLFTDLAEAEAALSRVKRTHTRAYLVELKVKKSARML
jgi:hypothetical protein